MRRSALALLLALSLLTLLKAVAFSAAAAAPVPDPGRLHPALQRALASAHPTDSIPIIVEWRRAPTLAVQAATAPDKATRRRQVVAALQQDAQLHAAELRQAIDEAASQGLASDVRSFWASPIIALKAQPTLIESLSARAEVVQIRPDERISLDPPTFQPAEAQPASPDLPTNLALIQVELAQQALGLDGSTVVVANMDTGVDWEHPALHTQYRGYNPKGPAVHAGNWYVATNEPYLYPGDGHGHGTHTMGTLVGDDGAGNRIGVAPGARWIAVKIFTNSGFTYESWLHDGFQWLLAPDGNPDLAPDIVNNSWGSNIGTDARFRPDVSAWRAAGILPIFSAGNNGPDPNTIGSPGSFPESLAVGAIDNEKAPADFSSRGPSAWDEVKPDIAAPGVQVRSSFPGGGYALANGTSMAAPHVAGVAALLLQGDPSLTPDELETILRQTAQPLARAVPNNDTGWGLVNAYAAGLRVTHHGELRGHVTRSDGAGVAQPAITAALRDGSQGVTVLGDASGAFTMALRPGSYDVTAHAFGFAPATEFSVPMVTGTQTGIQFQLTLLPHGSVFGQVMDSQTGAPLSATIVAEGTPVQVEADRNTGMYSLALPEGTWPLRVTASAHRITHITPTITAGSGLLVDVPLPPAPRILLVDSGPWYYDSQVRYYQDALDALDYPYTLWPIHNPGGAGGEPSDLPTTRTLTSYDVVIWSAPQDSPGMIGANAAITPALRMGVRFLVSGEDVAFWDGGGWPYMLPASYFWNDMALRYASEGNRADLGGVPATPLAGVTLTFNTPDSAGQQSLPDSATIADRVLTEPALTWPDGSIGGAVAGVCRPYRAAWLGFGLEGVGPRPARIAALGRLLDWLTAPPSPHGLAVVAATAPLIGAPGRSVSQAIRLTNSGVERGAFALDLTMGAWPLSLLLPDGRHVSASTSFTLAGCSSATLLATISIPPDLPRDQRTTYTLRLTNQADPAVAATVTLTAKTPAPLLLVDDERFYNNQDRFTRTLEALGVAYDIYDTQGGDFTPDSGVLARYPMVVWTTGYDWYAPLTKRDEANLSAYLGQRGRLLLSSQDLLDVRRLSDFVRTRLGVIDATLTVTPTQVMSLPDDALGADLGPWQLHFHFINWGDALVPAPSASSVLQDQHQNTVGVVNAAATWRTAFFAFPLETLDDAPRRQLFSRALLWLSTLGESRLTAPAIAAAGSRIPLTLTLRLATDQAQDGLRAVVPLPAEVALAPDSLRGPWSYDPAAHSLAWAGALAPGMTATLGADLDLAAGVTEGWDLPLLAQLYLGDGMTVTAEAPVVVGGPWLTLAKEVTPAEANPGETVQFTLTTANVGLAPATAVVTDMLPAGLALVTGTAQAERGDVIEAGWGITWTGALEPGAMTTITFGAVVTPSRAGLALINQAEVMDQNQRWRLARAAVQVPAHIYLPVLMK